MAWERLNGLLGKVDAERLPQLGQDFDILFNGGFQNGGLNLDEGLWVRRLCQFLKGIDVVVGDLTRRSKIGQLKLMQSIQKRSRIGRELFEKFLIKLRKHIGPPNGCRFAYTHDELLNYTGIAAIAQLDKWDRQILSH